MEFMVTEAAPGYWSYHISYVDTFTKPLCGKDIVTMVTAIPMNTWGFVGHLRERYCDECKKIYEEKSNASNKN